MKASKQSRREAKQLFRSCLANGSLDEDRARQVVRLLLERKPRGYLAALSHFQRLIKLDMDRRNAQVESAVALPADLQASLQASLGRLYGPGINFSFIQNPALLGGMRIKIGSDVYDGSVQAR